MEKLITKALNKSFNFEEFFKYFRVFGNVKPYFCAPDGYPLGQYQRKIRYNYILLYPAQIKCLNDNHFDWGRVNQANLVVKTANRHAFDFEKFYAYFSIYGPKPRPFVIDDGSEKGYDYPQRIRNIRLGRIKLTNEQKQRLTDLGFVWFVRNSKNRTKDGQILKNI